ncbi:MAG TPA: hypothetical protein VMN81_04600 [Vicinamibacterales bacterium]|nr:hypothetical protein [Vicinamibacterales bacterium]
MKSAYELAMERLRKKDEEEGRVETPLTEDQRAAIADARSLYAAKIAEAEILHKSKVAGVFDPAQLEELAENHRRDIARIRDDEERKIEQLRRKTED